VEPPEVIKCKHYDASPRPGRFNPARVTFRRMLGGQLTVKEHYLCEACAEELEHFFALRAGAINPPIEGPL
jgi:hypothetical protein